MGWESPEASDDEQPVTRVRISRGFWFDKGELAQSDWQAVTATNPSEFSDYGQYALETVSRNDAHEFINRLYARSGGNRSRLPTEAGWGPVLRRPRRDRMVARQ